MDADRAAELAAIGDDLRRAAAGVLDALGLGGATSKELAGALSIDPTTTRRITRMLAEGDDLILLTRAPKPAALDRLAVRALERGADQDAGTALRSAAERFDHAVKQAGSKAALTSAIRAVRDVGDDA